MHRQRLLLSGSSRIALDKIVCYYWRAWWATRTMTWNLNKMFVRFYFFLIFFFVSFNGGDNVQYFGELWSRELGQAPMLLTPRQALSSHPGIFTMILWESMNSSLSCRHRGSKHSKSIEPVCSKRPFLIGTLNLGSTVRGTACTPCGHRVVVQTSVPLQKGR